MLPVPEQRTKWLPIVFIMLAAAVTRIPGLMPPNFSAMIALAFCAGVYFPGRAGWWLPLAMFAGTDLLLNLYYKFYLGQDTFNPAKLVYLLGNYGVYLLVILLGRKFSRKASFLSLLGGGIFGAILFYLITNTLSWLFDPAYLKTLAGWLQSLTFGTKGYPPTWEFFINTLTSGGLFTGLFAGAMKLSEAAESAREKAEEKEEEEAEEPQSEPEPEETKG
jgi:hypothetical protein